MALGFEVADTAEDVSAVCRAPVGDEDEIAGVDETEDEILLGMLLYTFPCTSHTPFPCWQQDFPTVSGSPQQRLPLSHSFILTSVPLYGSPSKNTVSPLA